MPVCPKCGKVVKDLSKHLRRGRCKVKKRAKGSSPLPGSPEERIERIGRLGGW
ncbi:MAG: hypothetical protein HYU02_03900 [Thaumarchaeota archaeon]|nr:hypothetical protein [Nitrososphaerota archaeon]